MSNLSASFGVKLLNLLRLNSGVNDEDLILVQKNSNGDSKTYMMEWDNFLAEIGMDTDELVKVADTGGELVQDTFYDEVSPLNCPAATWTKLTMPDPFRIDTYLPTSVPTFTTFWDDTDQALKYPQAGGLGATRIAFNIKPTLANGSVQIRLSVDGFVVAGPEVVPLEVDAGFVNRIGEMYNVQVSQALVDDGVEFEVNPSVDCSVWSFGVVVNVFGQK